MKGWSPRMMRAAPVCGSRAESPSRSELAIPCRVGVVDHHLETFQERLGELAANGFGRSAENENHLHQSGGTDVVDRARQHGGPTQRQQLLCPAHARGCACRQDDGAYLRVRVLGVCHGCIKNSSILNRSAIRPVYERSLS